MLLLSSSSVRGYGLHRIFQIIKDGKFDGLDLYLDPFEHDFWDAEYIKSLSESFQVPVLSITAPSIGINKKRVDQIMDIATMLGTQVVTFSPPHISDRKSDWFDHYLPRVKKEHLISIAIQNVEPKFMFFIIPEYKNAALIDVKRVTGDTTLNLSAIDAGSGMDIIKAQKILGSSIKNVFLNDKKTTKRGMLPGMSGGGTSYLPIESFLLKLRAAGYDGHITLKVSPKELGAGNYDQVVQNMEHVRKYYTKHFIQS